MAYTVNEITELVRYHLVAAAPDDEAADRNLLRIMQDAGAMLAVPVSHEPMHWTVCEECGAWVSSELIDPDGAGECEDGGFYCTSCRFGEDD
jgi:hypothetical protein